MRDFSVSLKVWVLIAAVSTLFAGFIYAAVQHVLRTDANDPQIQMAQDAARALPTISQLPTFATSTADDITVSLVPFTMIYDSNGKAVTGSGKLNEAMPTPPGSVFDYVRTHGEDRFTWQPQANVRIAAVVDKVGGPNPGFVLVGRSLKEVEVRERDLLIETAAAWAVVLAVSGLLCWLFFKPAKEAAAVPAVNPPAGV